MMRILPLGVFRNVGEVCSDSVGKGSSLEGSTLEQYIDVRKRPHRIIPYTEIRELSMTMSFQPVLRQALLRG